MIKLLLLLFTACLYIGCEADQTIFCWGRQYQECYMSCYRAPSEQLVNQCLKHCDDFNPGCVTPKRNGKNK